MRKVFCLDWRATLLKAAALGLALFFLGRSGLGFAAPPVLRLLCTTFPIGLITANVVEGRPQIETGLMLPADLGCPHDYALTPQDIVRLAQADILVINGLGMESFLPVLLKNAAPQLRVIDSSQGVGPLLETTGTFPEEHVHEEHGHADTDVNPHLFASPRMAALLAVGIAQQLAALDGEYAELYLANGRLYAQKMNRLADDFAELGRRLRNNRIVTQHGVFDYLARDMGLAVVAVVQAHPGQEPSAAEILAIVQAIRQEGAGAVFTEPQYPDKIGRSIAREAGITAAVLDPAAGGPADAPLGYYEKVMRTNMTVLEKTLGVR